MTFFSFTFLVPAAIAAYYGEPMTITFVMAFVVTFLCGLTLWLPLRGNRELRGGDGFLITALFYIGLSLFGAIPLYFAESTSLTFSDAAFESMSGLTTTGAGWRCGLMGVAGGLWRADGTARRTGMLRADLHVYVDRQVA